MVRLVELEAGSVAAVVTDPPYGLRFMGKEWDHGIPGEPFWREVIRVMKPGAYMLAFGGTRTYHRLACAVEDAGFEIRDCLMWVYGQGFPKSLNVSKALDKKVGARRKVIGRYQPPGMTQPWNLKRAKDQRSVEVFASSRNNLDITAAATEAAQQWEGWGTALKPAYEPIILARKPLSGTVVQNIVEHGTGALNIDGCRVDAETGRPLRVGDYKATDNNVYAGRMDGSLAGGSKAQGETTQGRWPANLIHDGSDEVLAGFPAGSAARFFYCAKASKAERNAGLDGHTTKNCHPTVKPVALMRYLVRLVTPPGGLVLDPFFGSGSTGIACELEGFDCTGIELSEEYAALALRRLNADAGMFASAEVA